MNTLPSLWVRHWIEFAKRAALLAQRQPDHDVGDAIDLTWLPTDVRPQGPDRAVAGIPFICLHVTDIRGGYGVSRQLRRRWERKLDGGTFAAPDDVIAFLLTVPPEDRARLLGLLERYRRTIEYHRLVSYPGQQYRVHPLEIRTPHAGGWGNSGVGFAVDQANEERCEGARATNAIDLLLETAQEIRDAGRVEPVPLTAHRCVAPPSARAQDPGAHVWRAVAMPALAAEPGLVTCDYAFRRGKGRPIPRVWDPNALFDEKGRRL